jgi:hypothetical protein
MAFEDDNVVGKTTMNSGLKQSVGPKSMFDGLPKKPRQDDLDNQVKDIRNKSNAYKAKSADLGIKIMQLMKDQTLNINKNQIMSQVEMETIKNLIDLALEINNDDQEDSGIGSISCIVLLFKTCLLQRDKINNIEHKLSLLEKKIDGINSKSSAPLPLTI